MGAYARDFVDIKSAKRQTRLRSSFHAT